ncbi:M48 family metallopeptidase [Corallincola spongiicola]|uniref:Peptidase M48 domain-containing protein n=1 Tax=Corallincola spongiicola TaxID=2520508 RepID=A0ABY1WSM5_9GAMM|nr:M48 family metallopeptidase [Corallincola spongiicola]TAA47743.1 hypothetical protein EXY25_00385 [Corallincola spongiicola]
MEVPRFFLAVAVIALFVNGCTSTAHHVSDVQSSPNNFGLLPGEHEVISRSDGMHKELSENGVLLAADNELQTYLDTLLVSLLSAEERQANIYHIYLTRLPDFNAFAIANGNIYLNIGLAAGLKSPEQLAFVMAHEIEHINRRHSYKTYYDSKQSLELASALDILLLGTKLSYLGAYSSLASTSREFELDADTQALARLQRAGYATCLGPSALMRIKEVMPASNNADSTFASHPHIDLRIEELSAYYRTDCSNDKNQKEFKKIRQKIFALAIESMLHSDLPLMAQRTLSYAPDLLPGWKAHQLAALLHYQLAQQPIAAGKERAAWQGRDFTDEDAAPYQSAVEENSVIAITEAKAALALNPNEAQLYKTLGTVTYYSEPVEAIAAFQNYLALKPKSRDAKYVRYQIEKLMKTKEVL